MKKTLKKVMAMLLVIAMIAGIIPSVLAAPVEPFTDVDSAKWYGPAVQYVYKHGLMKGMTDTTFEPETNISRAMVVTVLYRIEGQPVVLEESTFTDVEPDRYFTFPIAWAQDEGVVNGRTETIFAPNDDVTREELVTMLYRYAGEPAVTGEYLGSFPDAGSTGNFAKDAMQWAVANGIINGMDGKLNPKGNATRAQLATILMRYNKLICEHVWDDGEVKTAATCTAAGEMTYTCTKCDETKVEAIPATDHTWNEGVVTTPATCVAAGEKTYTCTVCGETKVEAIAATGIHNYVDGVCTVCGDKLPIDEDDIVILYTNDVHTYIDKALSYATIADYKSQVSALAAGTFLVDAGDHLQGTAYGSMDEGATIIELMNAAGYDAATLGNHEFDYGMTRTLDAIDEADFPYVSANFYTVADGENVLDAYTVFTVGEGADAVKIAIVGITTPESITKSTPAYFMNEDQTQWVYGIDGGADGSDLYDSVQIAVDDALAEGVDYVIALGHLGNDTSSQPWTSEELIANTTGIDAFIDGHSHSTVEMKNVKNADGENVVLTQTGSYFNAIGQMTISADGTITTELIKGYTGVDADVKAIQDAWIAEVDTLLGEVIGKTTVALGGADSNSATGRLVRKMESNLGDFTADALYYLFNNTEELDVDIAIMNGGGIRADINTGDISYKTCKATHTFGNVACLMTVTGQQILDALEWGARDTTAAECGGFLQVSGLTYDIHTYITSTVQKDATGIWTGGPTGEYRVKNVQIWNKETGAYEDLDLNKTYNMAGYNYTLRDLGDGFAMFTGATLVKDYVMQDYLVLANYVKSFPVDSTSGLPTITANNSVLGSDYGDVYGEGRIEMVTEKPIVTEDYVLTNSLKAGDEVIIVCAAKNQAMSGGYSVGTFYPPSVAVTPVDGKIVNPDTAIVWTVGYDGTSYTFTNVNGDKLSMNDANNSLPLNEVNDTWKIIASSTANTFLVQNAVRTSFYVEYYETQGTWSSYSNTSSLALFELSFYVKGADAVCLHTSTEVRNAVAATCTAVGYTGDTYCTVCNAKVATGTITPMQAHNYVGGVCDVCGAIESANTSYVLVTDASQLVAGKKVVIAAPDADYAMSYNQKASNRGAAAVTKSGSTLTFESGTATTDVAEFVLGAGTTAGTYSFIDTVNSGYLRANISGAASNLLQLETTLTEAGSFTIAVEADGSAVVTSQATATDRNIMRYNAGDAANLLFSCYAPGSTVQGVLHLYIETEGGDDPCEHVVVVDAAVAATCTASGLTEGSHCSVCSAVLAAQTTVAALGHSYAITDTLAPTETVAGYTTYTCSRCPDTYTDIIPPLGTTQLTVSFSVPAGVTQTALSGSSGSSITLPTPTGTPTAPSQTYVFAGWAAAAVTDSTTAPTILAAGSSYTISANTTLYAVYTYTVSGGSGDYVKVTSAPADWSGDYLIVYEADSTSGIAFNGSLTALDVGQNGVSVTISNSTISAAAGDPYYFTIAPYSTGYSIQSVSGYYIGSTSTTGNTLLSSTGTQYANTITYNSSTSSVDILGGRYLRYNSATGDTNERFRYYTSTYGNPVQLYVKSAASTTYYTTTLS